MQPRLRHLLATAFMVIATVPVLMLGYWIENTAMKKELDAVSEKHLLLARNLAAAVDDYASDAKATFAFLIGPQNAPVFAAALDMAWRSGFSDFRIVDAEARTMFRLQGLGPGEDHISPGLLKRLHPFIGETVAFSDILPDDRGQPALFLLRRLSADRVAIGTLDLDFIRQEQREIVFGKNGHSAIVDRSGNVIAHPRADWRDQIKNLAKVKPVARLMKGESGFASFRGPAFNKDMVAGYAAAPGTGWGVMVSQPVEEIELRAGDIKRAALAMVFFGLFVSAFMSWVVSGLLVRPVEAVMQTSRGIAAGILESRVPRVAGLVPREFIELGAAFNAMARDIATEMIQRQRIEGELRQARDELETRVEERTRDLTQEIAERTRVEESLVRLAAAVEELHDNFALYDPDDRLVMCNRGYRLLNLPIAEATAPGVSFEDHLRAMVDKGLAPDAAGREQEWIRERLDRHKNPKGPFEIRRQDGIWLLVRDQRMPDGSTATISTDITDRKRAEDALRRSEERLRGAIQSLQEGFALFDADDRLVALNDEYARINPAAREIMARGGTFEELARANVARGVIADAVGREQAYIRERLARHRNPKGPIIRRFTDGSWYMLRESPTPEGGVALTFIDITELKRAEEAFRESRQQFKDIAEISSDWFWEMDENLRFSYFSGRNFKVTGYRPSDLIGKTRAEVSAETLKDPRWRRHLADMEARRPFHDFRYWLTTPGGRLHISVSGKPLFDSEGNFKGYRGAGTDITAQVKADEAMRAAMEEAKLANRAKTEFLANMSHELRTPLNSVIGFSDILSSQAFGPIDNPRYLDYIDNINSSGKHLLQLINDILDIARIERRHMTLDERRLDVPLLVISCRRLFHDRARDAGIVLTAKAEKTLPALYADELRTKQILINLLSNAIKFTPKGGRVDLHVAVDEENRFRLSIADTGIGISPEHLEAALSDFKQVDGSLTRKYDGAGLGLPLSKKLVELHGGELMIDSLPGVGTTVTVRFPCERTIRIT